MQMPLPSRKQIELQEMEMGIFIHFGVRTFYEAYEDFDARKMSPAMFSPSLLDCSQWVSTAKTAGFNYMVMTTKHHDGFSLWPSKYTDFSVAFSPWKDGKGDVVQEFTDACRANGIKAGVYYSPYDHDCPIYDHPQAYDDYFINQISELLTHYGDIAIIWLDGCGSEDHQYDWPRIVGEIRRMQPNIMIFHAGGEPDYRWVGNEDGIAPSPSWNTIGDEEIRATGLDPATKGKWLSAECDCRMRQKQWFYSENDEHTVKTLEQLMGIYYYSVGRGCNLLLNIGSDRRGLLPDKDTARLLEFGEEIRRRFGTPLAVTNDFIREENQWMYEPDQQIWLNHLVMQEDIANGERVRKFKIEVEMDKHLVARWIKVYEGESVGHKAICSFPPVPARGVRVTVLESDGSVKLKTLEIHCTI